jgi:hypothetical protein
MKLTESVMANSPAEAIEASTFQIGEMLLVKEVVVMLSPDCQQIGPAKWIVEARLIPGVVRQGDE